MTAKRVEHVPHLRIDQAYETACHHAELVARIALETGNSLPTPTTTTSLPGDTAALRGIPVVGVRGGRGGAIPGTRPTDAVR